MENILGKLFEHNNWANIKMIETCSALSDEQLDAEPGSATKGTIRETLRHLVASQMGYLSLLTGVNYRPKWEAPPPLAELQEAARASGEELLALARDERRIPVTRLRTSDGFYVEPWVLMVQIINHATEHREQISSMLTALRVTPPELDGWNFGWATKAFVPITA